MKTINDVIESLNSDKGSWDLTRVFLQSKCGNILVHSPQHIAFRRIIGFSYFYWDKKNTSLIQHLKIWWIIRKIKK